MYATIRNTPQLWELYLAFQLAYGPPPPWPADRTQEMQELEQAFTEFVAASKMLAGLNVSALWQDYLWVSRNGALEDWKPKTIDTHNQPI